jgi:hypothetical protein
MSTKKKRFWRESDQWLERKRRPSYYFMRLVVNEDNRRRRQLGQPQVFTP